MKKVALAFDLGGTELRAALVDEEGSLLSFSAVSTHAAGGPDAVIQQIELLAATVLAETPDLSPVGIGIGAPGPLDPEAGVVIAAPTLAGWHEVPLASILSSRFQLPVRLENDANAAALGEWRYGAGRGATSMVFVTVSTGIGGGVIADGRILHGRRGLAAEIGHMTITNEGERCFCGAIGCFEAVASGTALGRRATAHTRPSDGSVLRKLSANADVTGRHVVEAARKGDAEALELLKAEARWLGIGFTNLLHLYSPDVLVMGGGISHGFDLLHDKIAATVRDRAMPAYRDVPIVVAQLGRHAGLIGAASLILGSDGKTGLGPTSLDGSDNLGADTPAGKRRPAMANLKLRDARKSYGAIEVIKGIDLDVDDREFVVFVGPSGCGKSTLLRMIAGLEKITGGDLMINGTRANDVDPSQRGLAMVFQSYALYPHMTVAENMGFALKVAGVSTSERDQKVREAAQVLELAHLLDRRPKDLSGGQRQRVAIGRAIVRNPKIFLFDEPLSNLDAALRVNMRLELMRLHQDLAATMIYVTHDQIEAMTMADKIVVLNSGRIEQVGSPLELYNFPANIFVAGFIGSPKMNFMPATAKTVGPDGVSVVLPSGNTITVPVAAGTVKTGSKLTLGIRPEHIRIGHDGQFTGQVILAERLGGLTIFHVDTETGQSLVVQAEGADTTPLHTPISLQIDPGICHLFDDEGKSLAKLN